VNPVYRFFRRAFAVVALGALLLPQGAAAQGAMELRFLDVGQGDAILIRNGGRTVLVDTGPSQEIVPHLRRLGVDSIDLLVITHPHLDHLGGADAILERMPVRNFMDNGVPHTTNSYLEVVRLVRTKQVRYLRAEARRIAIGDASLEVVPVPASTRQDENLNNQSIGLVLRRGGFSALLTGDSEVEEINGWLASGALPAGVSVAKAAHHGSRNGVTPALLARTRPQLVVISVGAGNGYGHPNPWALRYFGAGGRTVLRTDLDGDVAVKVQSDGSFSIHTQRESSR
jgi:competence protein ComEC